MTYEADPSHGASAGRKPRAVMLSPTESQPRYHRRAAMLIEAGYDISVYHFQRGYYTQNTYPAPSDVTSLGNVAMGRWIRRIPRLVRAAAIIRKREKEQPAPALVYAFGLDMAMIARRALPRTTPLVFEVADVLNPLPHMSVVSKLGAVAERRMLRLCRALVVTSPAFITDYFALMHPGIEDKTLVIENMLARDVAARFPRPDRTIAPNRPLRIGYIGLFKYEHCIQCLMEAVARKGPQFQLHFFGDGPSKHMVTNFVDQHSNLFYHGSFSSQRDIGNIYQSVDVSYVVYDNHDPNVRMALPNKLYESLYFGVPIIVAEDTYLATRVREAACGLVVDPRKQGFADEMLDRLDGDTLAACSRRALALDTRHMVERYDEVIPKLIALGKP
ncbi:MAG TPA: glycosyltransferase [Phycisphaerales bacterium]|nr:glycosyltransferase [Phycisphaerales bacterium]